MQQERDLTFIGRNIRWLRRRAGLSQKDLAARIGIHHVPLCQIERGHNNPSSPVLDALARELKVPIAALFAEDDSTLRDEALSERRRPFHSDAKETLPEAIEETAEALIDAFLALEDICGAPKRARIPLCVPLVNTGNGMHDLALRARDFMDIRHGVVFDYFELFESFGFRVLVLPMAGGLDGFSFYDPVNYNAFFFINSRRNAERQIFRLVSELGHIYLLNWELQGGRLPAGGRSDAGDDFLDCRHAAAKFAAFFLMPEAAVRATVEQLGIESREWSYELLLRIKHRYGVSAESFLYRLDELDLIDGRCVPRLKRRIQAHYKKTNFEEPDSTRRVLTPNGRIWDLVLSAKETDRGQSEVPGIERLLEQVRVKRV